MERSQITVNLKMMDKKIIDFFFKDLMKYGK